MRALICVQSLDERSQIRPFLSTLTDNVVMVNSHEELMQQLKAPRAFEVLVMDDAFDAKSPDGETLSPGPSVVEVLQQIQAGFTNSPDVTILCLLRSAKLHNSPGTLSVFVDSNPEDRRQAYAELGATFFLEKPYTIEVLKKNLAELAKNAQSPPQWLTILKQLRLLYASERYLDALKILDKLAAAGLERQHMGFPLLRARCLAQMGPEHLPASVQVLESLREQFPSSLSIRMLLLENHLKLGRPDEAFKEQLGIFATQKTAFNFERTLQLMDEIHAHKVAAGADATVSAEDTLLSSARQVLEVLFKDPRPYSKKLRPRIFELLNSKIERQASWQALVEIVIDSDDIIEATAPLLKKALVELEKGSSGDNAETTAALHKGHLLMLTAIPDEAASLERVSQTLLDNGELEKLDSIFQKAEAAGAKSIEFHTSFARYMLKVGNLKAASDTIHKAVRIKADDIRVVELRHSWQREYDLLNNKTSA